MRLSVALNLAASALITTHPSVTAFTTTTLTLPPAAVSRSSSSSSSPAMRVANLPMTDEVASSASGGGGAREGQAEVVLVGCGAPNRGMGWYHAVQMLEGR